MLSHVSVRLLKPQLRSTVLDGLAKLFPHVISTSGLERN